MRHRIMEVEQKKKPVSVPIQKTQGTASLGRNPAAPLQAGLMSVQAGLGNRYVQRMVAQLQDGSNAAVTAQPDPGVMEDKKKENRTGLPDQLKLGIEQLSGYSLDDVRVHYNSSKPEKVQVLAYTQGTENHVAPGRECHLAHEAWHVVQQADGRVKRTSQIENGITVNNDRQLEWEADTMGTIAINLQEQNSVLMQAPVASEIWVDKLNQPSVTFANTNSLPIQRKGVKSELFDAHGKLEELEDESRKSRGLMNMVGDAMYEAYKPANSGQVPLSQNWDTKNRDKTKGSLSEDTARNLASRINNWADSANTAAARILEELKGVLEVNQVDLATIRMGLNTDVEPDASALTSSGKDFALESKYVTSAAQGAVDTNLVAASSQLQKRWNFQAQKITNTTFNSYIAHIHINNEENPWPFTPQNIGGDFRSTLAARIKKYKARSAAIPIIFRITFSNPIILAKIYPHNSWAETVT